MMRAGHKAVLPVDPGQFTSDAHGYTKLVPIGYCLTLMTCGRPRVYPQVLHHCKLRFGIFVS